MLMIKCPATGKPVETGIDLAPETFALLPDIGVRLKCPACGAEHEWTKQDAWIADEEPRQP